MPFPPGTPDILKGLYGVVEKSVYGRATTAQLWQDIRDALGVESTRGMGISISALSDLRSAAARVRDAESRLFDAGPDDELTAGDVARPVWARTDAELRAAPAYVVRYENLSVNPAWVEGMEGEPETISQWLSLRMEDLPGTAGELRDRLTAQLDTAIDTAATVTGTPARASVGIGRIQLLEV